MDATLIIGLILAAGFLFGELAEGIGLPKVTGYVLAGLALNPGFLGVIPAGFPDHTDPVTNIALSFITFSVGGSLLWSKVRALGRTILAIVLFEAELALLGVAVGTIVLVSVFHLGGFASWSGQVLAFGVLLGSLASPTDPSATLAVAHEYEAEGEVSSTIMGVAAFDDALGIINYSLCLALARFVLADSSAVSLDSLLRPFLEIGGGVALGALAGAALNKVSDLLERETEGAMIVLIFATLSLCFGAARLLGIDELLATMTMGAVVVNFNRRQEKIFGMLRRYTEELVFVLFFTLSGMHLKFSVLWGVAPIMVIFVMSRGAGKIAGTALGAALAGASRKVRRYTALGLIPQGGIVIGLALMIRSDPAFSAVADPVMGVVIGATVVHELAGPIAAKAALERAGEISGRG